MGKGYGSEMIRLATAKYLKDNPEVTRLIAEIKPDNIASIKAFEKAGYKNKGG